MIAGIKRSNRLACLKPANLAGFQTGGAKVEPKLARSYVASLLSLHVKSRDGLSNPYLFSSERENSIAINQINSLLIYKLISRLPLDILVDVLSLGETGGSPDLGEFQAKAAFLVSFESERPQDFGYLLREANGPFIGNGISPSLAAERLERFYRDASYDLDNRLQIIMDILNSTYLSQDYLKAVVKKLPEDVVNELKGSRGFSSTLTNYSIMKALGCEPLKSEPEKVYQYLYKNAYHFDADVIGEILSDARALSDDEFVRLIKTFMNRAGGGAIMDSHMPSDFTGLGWLYSYFKSIGDAHKVELLMKNSNGYFDQAELLRGHGVNINLYRRGGFDLPIKDEEVAAIADELKRLPPEKLNAIKGITIIDGPCKDKTLGTHDTFGNIVLYRRYDKRDISKGIRIENVPFIRELVIHERWHADEEDLSKDEFKLYARIAGYQRIGLYSPEYTIVESRKMVSAFHDNIYEEFAEAGTNYELAPSTFRKSALEALSQGDVYLVLEYLFFKYIPEETRGKEYPQDIPAEEKIDIDSVREKVLLLKESGVVSAEKAEWVLARLIEIEGAGL